MPTSLVLKSLREQVYEHLRERISSGGLLPGAFLDLGALSRELGISKTPLRDALLQLETEGFVSILPRRGVVVNLLSLEDIRHLYQIIGALESAAVVAGGKRITPATLGAMRSLNAEMVTALKADSFDAYYRANLAFHGEFLRLSDNPRLVRMVSTYKQRLYDFPRREAFVKEWELASTQEHAAFVDLLADGEVRGAADHLRDVHWSFDVQREFIDRYYFASQDLLAGNG